MLNLIKKIINFPKLKSDEEIKKIVAQEIKRHKTALPITANYDPHGEGYRPLASYSAQRNLQSIDQDRMIEIAYFMEDASTMFKRLAKLDKTFLFSEPIQIIAENPKVQELLDEFWEHPVNQMDINFPDSVMWLGILGEQCWPTHVNKYNGVVEIGYVDPQDIKDIHVYKYNRRRHGKVELRGSYNKPGKKLKIINQNINPLDKKRYGYLTGDCFFYSLNHPPNAPRGRSDFLTLFDWIDSLERYGFNYLERAEFMLNFVWDVTLKGMDEDDIRDWLKKNPPPEPGSVRAHNENAEWKAIAPKLEAFDFTQGFTTLKAFILGSHGRPDSWYGEGGKAYQNEADMMGQVPLKDFDERQRLVKAIVKQMINYQIDQGIIYGRLPERINKKYKLEMPEISKKDLARLAAVMPQLTNALEVATNHSWVTFETAAKYFLLALQQSGLDINIQTEIKEAKKEKEKKEKEAETIMKNNGNGDGNNNGNNGKSNNRNQNQKQFQNQFEKV